MDNEDFFPPVYANSYHMQMHVTTRTVTCVGAAVPLTSTVSCSQL